MCRHVKRRAAAAVQHSGSPVASFRPDAPSAWLNLLGGLHAELQTLKRRAHLLLQNVNGALVARQGGGLPRRQLVECLLGADALALRGQVADRALLLPDLGCQLLLLKANRQPRFSTVQCIPACCGTCTCQPQLLKVLLY